ncbi:MAG TPA: membrane dipeptidase [Mucilaginibacter sp.]|jgi:microsomal dipeptidase-like Zn-dependent dipeptidase|nr:membrane dipeptidase [Mucilaginibacter sp.]
MESPTTSVPTRVVEQQVFDIHCHPCLKTWLFPSHHVYDTFYPSSPDFSENCFVNIDEMQTGNVGAGVSVYYLPEAELETEHMKSVLMTLALDALKLLCGRLPLIVEDKSTPSASFNQMQTYINTFVSDIHTATGMGYNVAIANSFADLQANLNNGTTVFLHSLEGAHCLGNYPITFDELVSNLTWFFNIGVCQITLGHFFENILVSSSGGIPPGLATSLNYDPDSSKTYLNGYNGQLAMDVIDKILDLGIIIDLVHTYPDAKQMVYDRNNARGANKRPLTFAHTGIYEIAMRHNPGMDPKYARVLPNSADITAIKDCNGVLGLIFMDYWLTGDDDHRPAIAAIVESIIFIRDVPDSAGNSGTYDHIAIGTDLDGFTTIPDDLLGEVHMKDLVDAIAGIDGISDQDIDNICWSNYMRVLQNGWGKA